jgi:hypothetical protein
MFVTLTSVRLVCFFSGSSLIVVMGLRNGSARTCILGLLTVGCCIKQFSSKFFRHLQMP